MWWHMIDWPCKQGIINFGITLSQSDGRHRSVTECLCSLVSRFSLHLSTREWSSNCSVTEKWMWVFLLLVLRYLCLKIVKTTHCEPTAWQFNKYHVQHLTCDNALSIIIVDWIRRRIWWSTWSQVCWWEPLLCVLAYLCWFIAENDFNDGQFQNLEWIEYLPKFQKVAKLRLFHNLVKKTQ